MDHGSMKEEGGSDLSVRSRKRKANVAVFLQDPDEEIATIDETVKSQDSSQLWHDNSACVDPCSFIPTPNKEDDNELEYPKTALSFGRSDHPEPPHFPS